MKRTRKNLPGHSSKNHSSKSVEWLTLGLLFAVWTLFLIGTWLIGTYSFWVALPLLAPIVTLHSSLVHEAIHGHPTRSARVNELLLTVNPGLFIPYGAFRDSHRAHHETPELTDPILDTESNFLSQSQWESLEVLGKLLRRANATLLGRLLTGPAYTLAAFAKIEIRRLMEDKSDARASWVRHTFGCIVVLYWLVVVCDIAPVAYVLLVAYPAMSLLTLRTYVEHNWDPDPKARTAIVESGWLLSLLFLNNNLHAVHHDHPHIPWYQLPRFYRSRREQYVSRENFFSGYGQVVARCATRAYSPIIHPADCTR